MRLKLLMRRLQPDPGLIGRVLLQKPRVFGLVDLTFVETQDFVLEFRVFDILECSH